MNPPATLPAATAAARAGSASATLAALSHSHRAPRAIHPAAAVRNASTRGTSASRCRPPQAASSLSMPVSSRRSRAHSRCRRSLNAVRAALGSSEAGAGGKMPAAAQEAVSRRRSRDTTRTRRPRPASSRAIDRPMMPPPMMQQSGARSAGWLTRAQALVGTSGESATFTQTWTWGAPRKCQTNAGPSSRQLSQTLSSPRSPCE